MKFFKTLLTALICATAFVGCATPNERVSVYRYNIFDATGYSYGEGRFELKESLQGATVRIVFASYGVSKCVSSPHKATVTRDETFTTIVAEPAFGNCDSTKYQIRNDGTGGSRYTLVDGQWSKDQFNRGLTPKD